MRTAKPAAKSVSLPWLTLLVLACGSTPVWAEGPWRIQHEVLGTGAPESCLFSLSSQRMPGPMVSALHIVLTRRGAGGCAGGEGRVELGTTYDDSSLSLLVTAAGLVVGFSVKDTPGGSAPVSIELLHLDPQTLERVRDTRLSASQPFSVGRVEDARLSFGADGTTLEVRGSKSGVIPGEVGSGDAYLALYPDFLTSTTEPSVTAGEP